MNNTNNGYVQVFFAHKEGKIGGGGMNNRYIQMNNPYQDAIQTGYRLEEKG